MHSSDSFSNGVQPYLEAYASRRSYVPIGDEKEDGQRRTSDGGGAEREGRQQLSWRRAVGVVAIVGLFCAAVSASSSWRFDPGGRTSAAEQPLQDGGRSYHAMLDAFEKGNLMVGRCEHGSNWSSRSSLSLPVSLIYDGSI
ncbi:unnamed protein product [Ectocarpus sp. 8 AP-2014]